MERNTSTLGGRISRSAPAAANLFARAWELGKALRVGSRRLIRVQRIGNGKLLRALEELLPFNPRDSPYHQKIPGAAKTIQQRHAKREFESACRNDMAVITHVSVFVVVQRPGLRKNAVWIANPCRFV